MEYVIGKWLHILSSTVLFGTGIGSAYYMLFVSLTRDARAVAVVSRYLVIADWLFTATTVVFQLLSGLYLIGLAGIPIATRWVLWSLVLFALAVACWLPVVWLQIRMRALAEEAVQAGGALPQRYFSLLKVWVALGVPAFFAFLTVFYLMVAKPV